MGKTLKNLGVVPGDVVCYAGGDTYRVGEHKTLFHIEGGRDCGYYSSWDSAPYFTVVSRKPVMSVEELL